MRVPQITNRVILVALVAIVAVSGATGAGPGLCPESGFQSGPQARSLCLAHMTLIDVVAGVGRPNMTIVITGDHISEIGEDGKVAVPEGASVMDEAGKFVIPGLWDMHVHWDYKDSLSLFTANGVTGIREMFGQSDMLEWRKEIAKGTLIGPRMIVASPIIDGPTPCGRDRSP